MVFRKYHNRKVRVDGIKFDSVREAKRWQELKLMERAGEIRDLQRQVEYELLPTQKLRDWKTGKKKTERAIKYIADFVYRDAAGDLVVEDTKGMKTRDYIMKRKMMLWFYCIQIHEV